MTRRYLGGQSYSISTIAQADDVEDANGKDILDFWQAQEVTRNLRPSAVRSGPYTVRDAVDAYLDHLEGRPSWRDTKKRLEAFALPVFGDRVVNELDEDEIRRWHRKIAKTPARSRTKAGAEQAYKSGDLSDPEVARKRQASANRCLALLKAALNQACSWPGLKTVSMIRDTRALHPISLQDSPSVSSKRRISRRPSSARIASH
ncbi:MAG: hypothetical protein WD852_06635 [Methyloceanibacter sp.]